MAQERIGVWVIGALGGVSTTATVGLAALQKNLSDETALVSALPQFQGLGFAEWPQFVVGGHEIRESTFAAEAQQLYDQSHVFDPKLLEGVAPVLAEFDKNVRPGSLINVGATISSFAGPKARQTAGERPAAALERLAGDITEFRNRHKLAHVVVINLASTEPPLADAAKYTRWAELSKVLDTASESPVPASSLYAVAAMQSGCSYINFTPSIGSDLPALNELALERGVLHVGRDGKTGETLMKSVLAPMFAARNLHVMSWVGHNIFGNLDGKVLDDPINKANKVRSKDHLLTEILGYKPQTLVSIEYIESMGDWKTAWDHIHFQGFLGTKMMLQFTWQGCDSLLAAPLALDLIRFAERERRRGKSGVMSFLSSFFKSPMGCDVPEFAKQYALLEQWAHEVRSEAAGR
jgi:myo-inositol-1-phosphate synthase